MQTKTVKILVISNLILLCSSTSVYLFSNEASSAVRSTPHVAATKVASKTKSNQKSVQVKPHSGIAESSRNYGMTETFRKYNNEIECLAAVVYHEARGESDKGKYAVADVTLNRVDNPDYPKSVCSVVSEKGQYSWYRKNKRLVRLPKNKQAHDAWKDSKKIAVSAMIVRNRAVGKKALYFHSVRVRPEWAKNMKVVARIDGHVFLAPRPLKS